MHYIYAYNEFYINDLILSFSTQAAILGVITVIHHILSVFAFTPLVAAAHQGCSAAHLVPMSMQPACLYHLTTHFTEGLN